MTDVKISALGALAAPVPSTTLIAAVEGGTTYKMLLQYILTGGSQAITILPALTVVDQAADYLVIADASGSANKKVRVPDLFRGGGGLESNTILGSSAGSANTTGYDNSFFGWDAGYSNTTGNCNSFFGRSAGSANTTGNYNSFFGQSAGYSNTTGNYNSFFGRDAGYSNTTGYDNSFFGWDAGYSNTTGNYNSFFGRSAGSANTTGNYNSFFGRSAGSANTTGSNLTCVGYNSQPSAADATNEITLGDANVTTLRCNTQTITALSDRRDKASIEPIPLGLDFIKSLKPSKWIWACRDGSKVGLEDTGFIAQDLDDSQQKFGYEIPGLVFKPTDDRWEASTGKLLTVAIRAIQELAAEVEELKFRGCKCDRQ